MRRLAVFPTLLCALGLAFASPASAADPGAPTTPVLKPLSYAGAATTPAEVVSWKRSTGGTGTVHYLVFRDGAQIADTTNRSVSDANPPVGVQLTYAVQAYDEAGHHSDLSVPLSTTIDPPSTTGSGTTPPAGPPVPRGVPAPAPAPAPAPPAAAPAASSVAAPPVADLPIQDVSALFAKPDTAAPAVQVRTSVTRGRLSITAGASDAGQIKTLQVRLDGRVLRQVSGGALKVSRRVRGARRRHVLVVSAIDAVGNVQTLRRTVRF